MSAQQFLAAKNVAVSPPPLPPYTSDLTPCYFFFPRMKSEPRGRCSWDVPEIQEQLLIGLRMTPASQLQRCLQEQQKLNNIYIYIYIYILIYLVIDSVVGFLINLSLSHYMGRDGAVGIATRCGLERPGIDSRWRRDFPHPSWPALEPTHPPTQWVPDLLPWGKVA